MALKRAVTTGSGYVAEYHVAVLTNIDWFNKQAHIEVVSWKDEAARRAKLDPVGAVAFDWKGEDFPFQAGDNVQQKSYQKIKTLTAWQESEDV